MRFGTYGKLKSVGHPCRTDIGNYETDFITVGKLDRDSGYFEGKTHMEMFKEFHFLSDAKKKVILQKQYDEEIQWADAKINYLLDYNDGLVVEIGNEPNLFPYISPELYAWYYKLWHRFVKRIDPNIKIMNGGLWIFSGLPEGIMKCLPFLGVKHRTAYWYYTAFLLKLDSSEWPDIVNLHFYPYLNKMTGLNDNIWRLEKLISIMATSKEVCISEYGNINSLSESNTNILVSSIIEGMRKIPQIKSAYYFKATGTDSKLKTFQAEMNKWKSKRLVRWVLKTSRRRGFKWVSKLLPKLFGKIPGGNALELLWLANKYSEQLPIQGLETDGKLNSLGKTYFEAIKRKS